jgi:hypothetical protein
VGVLQCCSEMGRKGKKCKKMSKEPKNKKYVCVIVSPEVSLIKESHGQVGESGSNAGPLGSLEYFQ